jgi:hypothetical protein
VSGALSVFRAKNGANSSFPITGRVDNSAFGERALGRRFIGYRFYWVVGAHVSLVRRRYPPAPATRWQTGVSGEIFRGELLNILEKSMLQT